MASQPQAYIEQPQDAFAGIGDAEMMAFAQQFNEIEPSAGTIMSSSVFSEQFNNLEYAGQLDALIVLVILATALMLSLPFLRRFFNRYE